MPFIDTLTVLAKLKTRLVALEIEPGTPLFDKVEYYSSTDLLKALQELRVFKNRVCLIVPGDDDFFNEVSGRSLTTVVERHVFLLLADRDYGRRQAAATGDENTPGVIAMKDHVVADLTGKNLDSRMVLVKPVNGTPLLIQGPKREEAAGREAWNLELAVECGQMLTQH
ncbi:MAG: hypothetical protein K0Q55_1948 [Verrucomicrobia bacterium]|jgi:hypothetical protein|nr:hypothetical protein [Verrucomicrobiota bacterium]